MMKRVGISGRHVAPGLIGILLAVVLPCSFIAWHSAKAGVVYLRPHHKRVERPEAVGEFAHLTDITLHTLDRLNIHAWYIPSKNHAGVILTHGLGQNRSDMLWEARLLAKQGYGVLLFDWRAHGESDGEKSTLGDGEAGDLQAALDYLASRPEIDSGRIGALGFSMGSWVVADVAAQDSRIAAVVLEGSTASLNSMIEEDFGKWGLLSTLPVAWTYRQAGIHMDLVSPMKAIARIYPRPILLIAGTKDDDTPAKTEADLCQAAGGAQNCWTVEGAGHGEYSRIAPAEYARRLTRFFGAALVSSQVGATILRSQEKP